MERLVVVGNPGRVFRWRKRVATLGGRFGFGFGVGVVVARASHDEDRCLKRFVGK